MSIADTGHTRQSAADLVAVGRTATASTAKHVAERRARIARLDRLADALDTRFRIPGLGLRVGWDSILGLIPGLGDLVTAGPGAVMLYEAHRMGARKRAMAGIGINTGIDMILGSIPLVGDVFDAVFKSHRRNIAILKRELARIEAREENEAPSQKAGARPGGPQPPVSPKATTPRATASAMRGQPFTARKGEIR